MDYTTILGIIIAVLISVLITVIIRSCTQNKRWIQLGHYIQRLVQYINANRGAGLFKFNAIEPEGGCYSNIPNYIEAERCSGEYEAAQIAYREDHVTHLLTNERWLYRSNCNSHAEVILTKRTQAHNITTIWIKNSPCVECSQALINFFHNCINKPTIYVGRIYRIDKQEDDETFKKQFQENREGLKKLYQQGFELKVWETLHTMMYGSYSRKTHNYLNDVKEEACDT